MIRRIIRSIYIVYGDHKGGIEGPAGPADPANAILPLSETVYNARPLLARPLPTPYAGSGPVSTDGMRMRQSDHVIEILS